MWQHQELNVGDRDTHSTLRVNGASVDIEVLFGKHLGALVDGKTGTVEDATQHIFRDAELHAVTDKLDPRLCRKFEVSYGARISAP